MYAGTRITNDPASGDLDVNIRIPREVVERMQGHIVDSVVDKTVKGIIANPETMERILKTMSWTAIGAAVSERVIARITEAFNGNLNHNEDKNV